MQEVVVSAPRIEESGLLNGSQLGRGDLTPLQSANSDTASLLANQPGVSLYRNGGVSSLPVIHGLADDRLRVQVDGMNLISACANHMNPPLSYIDPTNVGSVQVFAGITPVSVGGDSIGGTIQMNSTAPEFAKPGAGPLLKGEAGAFYRSNGDARGGNLAATVASEQLNLTYTGSTAQSDNYQAARDFKPAGLAAADRGWLGGDEVGSSRYKTENQDIGLALRHDNHLLQLKLGVQEMPYQGFPNQRMDMTENDSVHGILRYTGQYRWGALEASIYDEHTRHRMNFADDKQFQYGTLPASPVNGMPMHTDGENRGALLKGDIILSDRDILRVGTEVQRYRLDDWWPPSGGMMMSPNTFWNIHGGQRDRLALFAEWEARWNAQWTSQLGVRGDQVSMDTGTIQGYNNWYGNPSNPTSIPGAFNAANRQRTDNNLDLTALVRYTPGATNSFEAGYAQKTRSPNLYERYAWSTNAMAMEMVNFAGDGNYYVGNLNLRPEVAHTVSATAAWHDVTQERWGLKITPYLTYVHDYIDAKRLPASAATTFVSLQFVNQSARLYGVDVSGSFAVADTRDYGRFTGTGLLNYVRGENETTGDNLYNMMPLNGKLAIVQRVGNWTNTVEEQLVAPKTAVSQTRDELKTGGYGLLNLRTSHPWHQVRFDVGIENLLDKFYNPPLGGAYVGQGATMSGGAIPWGIPIPGRGRSIHAGMTVTF
ncbi:MAG: TonB-dependent receptor [Magnetococcales bacterium]|nr:TonB-dependent receptor [Magnetococcales bacterium]